MSEESEVALKAKWDEIALELGHVAIEWSKIEFYLSRIFVGVTGITESVAALLVRRLAGSGMDATVGPLLATLPPTDAEPIREWLRDVKQLREQRNTILHGTLVNHSDGEVWHPTNIQYRFDRATGEATLSGARLSADELREFREDMRQLAERYVELPRIALPGLTTEG